MTNGISKLLLVGLMTIVPASGQFTGRIQACVAAEDEVPSLPVVRAKKIAGWMFAKAGVSIDWRSGADSVCKQAARPDVVSLRVVTGMSANFHQGSLAFAQMSEDSEIVVMFDRIDRCATGIDHASQISYILANVFAHEITHILQGVPRHSESGVMKAQWSPRDVCEMSQRPLPFTPEDVQLIQLGIARRARNPSVAADPIAERTHASR